MRFWSFLTSRNKCVLKITPISNIGEVQRQLSADCKMQAADSYSFSIPQRYFKYNVIGRSQGWEWTPWNGHTHFPGKSRKATVIGNGLSEEQCQSVRAWFGAGWSCGFGQFTRACERRCCRPTLHWQDYAGDTRAISSVTKAEVLFCFSPELSYSGFFALK